MAVFLNASGRMADSATIQIYKIVGGRWLTARLHEN